MRKRTVLRLFLPFLLAPIGLVLALFAGWILFCSTGILFSLFDADPPGGCPISWRSRSMLVGSMLGSLFGCAIAFPRGSASTGRRILSFILALAAVLLVPHAFFPLIETIPPHYDDDGTSMYILSLLVIPALSLLGFSISVLLYGLKYVWTHRGEGMRK